MRAETKQGALHAVHLQCPREGGGELRTSLVFALNPRLLLSLRLILTGTLTVEGKGALSTGGDISVKGSLPSLGLRSDPREVVEATGLGVSRHYPQEMT